MNLSSKSRLLLLVALVFVVLTSGCAGVQEYSDEERGIETGTVKKVRVYKIVNTSGTLKMSGQAVNYTMFIPYSGKYQEIDAPEILKTKKDEYGNHLTTVNENYSLVFQFDVDPRENDFEDHKYPFEAPEKYSRYLGKTRRISPNHSEIKEISKDLTKEKNSSFEVIKSFNNWTNNYLEYQILGRNDLKIDEILSQKRGSCEEFTWLYASLARSAGIPTKVVAGWVEQNGNLDAHLWAESYVPGNGWIYVEPSNQEFKVMGTPHLKRYVGPDKLSEKYYGPAPERSIELHFNSTEYNCIDKEGVDSCKKISTTEIKGEL